MAADQRVGEALDDGGLKLGALRAAGAAAAALEEQTAQRLHRHTGQLGVERRAQRRLVVGARRQLGAEPLERRLHAAARHVGVRRLPRVVALLRLPHAGGRVHAAVRVDLRLNAAEIDALGLGLVVVLVIARCRQLRGPLRLQLGSTRRQLVSTLHQTCRGAQLLLARALLLLLAQLLIQRLARGLEHPHLLLLRDVERVDLQSLLQQLGVPLLLGRLRNRLRANRLRDVELRRAAAPVDVDALRSGERGEGDGRRGANGDRRHRDCALAGGERGEHDGGDRHS